MEEEIRGPKNLQGLLKFCLNADDGGNMKDSNINREEAEKKAEWLKTVMAETYVNLGEKIKEHIIILYHVVEKNEICENAIGALIDLQDITENIEYAKDFIKMGGLELTIKLLDFCLEDLLAETCQLIGNITQNDEDCQNSAVTAGLVEILLSKINNCNSVDLKKKMVYALSCCIRGNIHGANRFKAANGTQILIECMSSGETATEAKCAFLLYCLVSDSNNIESVLSEDDIVKLITLIQKMSNFSSSTMEHLFGIIACVFKQNSVFQKCISSDFISWVSSKLGEIREQVELEELISHINSILDHFSSVNK